MPREENESFHVFEVVELIHLSLCPNTSVRKKALLLGKDTSHVARLLYEINAKLKREALRL